MRNDGTRDGKSVLQVYVRRPAEVRPRPEKELQAFEKPAISAAATQGVAIHLDKYSVSYYDAKEAC